MLILAYTYMSKSQTGGKLETLTAWKQQKKNQRYLSVHRQGHSGHSGYFSPLQQPLQEQTTGIGGASFRAKWPLISELEL